MTSARKILKKSLNNSTKTHIRSWKTGSQSPSSKFASKIDSIHSLASSAILWPFKVSDKRLKKSFNLKKFGGRGDIDGDGVLNHKDCQPRNVMRQDASGDRLKRMTKRRLF